MPGLPQRGIGPRRPPLPGTGEVPEPAEAIDAPDALWSSLMEEVEGLTRRVDARTKRMDALEGRLAVLEGRAPLR